jgi:Ni/Fe-hydrogenase subunit HybB-like protein
MSLLLAGARFRINTYLIGYDPGRGWSYFPSVSEIRIMVNAIKLRLNY